MATTTLEELVVKFSGDIASLEASYNRLRELSLQTSGRLKEDASKMEDSAKGIGAAVQATAAGLAVLGAGHWLREAAHEWAIAETTALRLESAIRSNGRAVQPLMSQYQEFAADLQKITVYGDDATLAVIAQAESFGLYGEEATKATEHATALAAINGGAASSYLRLTAAIERGDTEMAMRMARMVPQLRGIKDETEFLEKANRLFTSGMAAARAEASSSQGQITQLKNAYGDLMEGFGKIYAEGIKPLIVAMREVVSWVDSWSQGTKELAVHLAMATTAALSLASAAKGLAALGLLGRLGSLTGAAAGPAAVMTVAGVAAFELFRITTGVDRLNVALERSASMARSLEALNAQRGTTALASANSISNPVRRQEALQDQLLNAQSEAARFRERQANASRRLEELRAPGTTLAQRWANFEEINRLVDQVESLGTAATEADTRVAALRAALQALEEDNSNRADTTFIDIVDKIEEEMRGLGEDSAMRRDLRRAELAGASEDALAEIRNRHEILNTRREEVALQERLRNQDTTGLSQNWRDSIRAFELGLEQLSEEFADAARLEEQWARSAENSQRRVQLVEQVDPLARYTRQVRELNELMQDPSNALSQDQYNRVLAQYASELNGVGNEAQRAASSVERFNAVASGSAAAASNLAEYVRGATSRFGRAGSSAPAVSAASASPADPAGFGFGLIQVLRVLQEIRDQGGIQFVQTTQSIFGTGG